MALTLPPALLSAQDAPVRHPVVELKTSQFDESLPFKGRRLDEAFKDEFGLSAIRHSSGRVCAAYIIYYNDKERTPELQYVYTNLDRTEFNYVTVLNRQTNTKDLVLYELKDKNIGLIIMYGNGDMYACILSVEGVVIKSKAIAKTSGGYGAGILGRGEDYLMMYSKPASTVIPKIGGSYTDTVNREYTLIVTKDGTNADSAFKYGNLQDGIPMASGAVIPITCGLTVTFPAAYYFKGQEFYFTAYRATYSTCMLTIHELPKDGATIVIAEQTYTYRENLTLLPEHPEDPDSLLTVQVPYEVKIDSQSKEITLENLNCAINAGSYDESGAGERYANGSAAHPKIYSERKRGTTFITLTARQAGGLTYPVALGEGCGISLYNTENSGLSGGANSSFSVISTLPSCKTYTVVSQDFLNWSEPKEMLLQGVVPVRNKQRYYFTKLSDGNVMLWFDCVTGGRDALTAITNIFYALSTDGGYAFGAAKAVTNFTTPQIMTKDARCVEKTASRLTLSYSELHSCMRMKRDTPGLPTGNTKDIAGLIFSIDFVRRRAYVDSDESEDIFFSQSGNVNYLLEIDIDEWRILRFWDKNTAPALPAMITGGLTNLGTQFLQFKPSFNTYGNGRYVIDVRPNLHHITVLDTIGNRIVELQFAAWQVWNDAHYSYKSNVDISGTSISGEHRPIGAYVDDKSEKLWILLGDTAQNQSHAESDRQEFAYMDLDEIFDMSVNRYNASVVVSIPDQRRRNLNFIDFNAEENAWTFCWSDGNVHVLDGNTWGALYKINQSNCANYPRAGLFSATYRNGKIYGGANNTTDEGKYNGVQGLCIVELSTMSASYHIPPFVPISYYGGLTIYRLVVSKEELVIFPAVSDRTYGLCVYNVKTDKWTVINSKTVPGFTEPEVIYGFHHVAYDEATGNIYTMQHSSYIGEGFQCVNVNGKVERLVYSKGEIHEEEAQTKITFDSPRLLVKSTNETNGHIFYDEEDHLYALWQRRASGYRKIFWDKEADELDLSKYLLRGAEITTTKTIDGTPNSLSFELANGHLFDATNTQSLMSGYLKKGKKITLRLGENVGGMVTWQTDADTFVVTGTSLMFKRNQYPTIKIDCKDRRTFFEQMRITATPYYAKVAPHSLLAGLLQEHGGYTAMHIKLDPFDEADAAVKGQFIDQTLAEILDDIGSRFGYFPAVVPGDVFTMRKINLDAAPAHVYSGAAWLIDYTPDDSFSDLTNKITVTGESPDKTAVVMPEELVAQDSGTIGWFKRKKTKRLYYSDDGTKTCLYPRMVKLETASSVAFKLAGSIREKIGTVDPNNAWVEVEVDGPDLSGVFIGALALIMAAKAFPPTPMGGTSKIAGTMDSMGTWLAFQCVGAIANYQYEIYAQPVGYVRRSFESSVTDDDLIREANGAIVERKLDEALCYTVEQCRKVAEFELKIAKAQRSRVKMTKIAHLQDEVGDVIEINHPYNTLRQRIFLTDITRRILIPTIGSADGHILDEIEGWKL